MPTIRVDLGPRSYDIAITSRDAGGWLPFLKSLSPKGRKLFFVADTHTVGLMLALKETAVGFDCAHAVVPAGEASKSMDMFTFLLDELAAFRADRQTAVVAVGGGVVGDLAGFAASAWNRGLPFIQVPTTLLAMVDSSVGGKVGINHPTGKNLIGAFHQPRGVWIDVGTLDSLPDREYRSGLAEVVKYGVIQDAAFFEFLERNAEGILRRDADLLMPIVARCCRLKADVVEKDEREETGLRMILNYGHTFAHAFESAAGYGTWLHGEAVAAGMVCASRLAERLQMIPKELTERQFALLEKFGLPTAPLPNWPTDDLLDSMRRDKKAEAGRLRFVLPTDFGAVGVVEGVAEADVIAVLAES